MGSAIDADVLAQLIAFVEQTSDFVGVSDPWGRVLYLNPAAQKLLGVADYDGLTAADLFPADSFGQYYEVVRPQLLRTGAWSGEVLMNVPGIGAVPMHVSATARIGPGGETTGVVLYAHDLPRDPSRSADARPDDGAVGLIERRGESVTIAEFRVALSHGHVQPYAQPVVDVASGVVVGYRGVTRWHHQRLGVLEAAAFIDMIAATPLAAQVDLYIARETAAVLTLVTRDLPLRLYTPVSARFLEDVHAEQYLSEIADAFFLTPGQIRLRVPRAALQDATPALRTAVQELAEAGVGLVLTNVEQATDIGDHADEGFGEFHLSHRLSRHDISQIVRTAHDQGFIVGATGVSSPEHHDMLVETGCDIASGDLYGRLEPCRGID